MKTVLIVEDDPSNMDVFQYIFQNDGFRVLGARTGNDALRAVQSTRDSIDLVICDLQLPDDSGAHIALDLVQVHPEAAVLFLSGTPLGKWNDADLEHFRRLSSTRTDFLEKPFFPSMLKEKAGALLNEKAAIRGERAKPPAPVGGRTSKSGSENAHSRAIDSRYEDLLKNLLTGGSIPVTDVIESGPVLDDLVQTGLVEIAQAQERRFLGEPSPEYRLTPSGRTVAQALSRTG